MKASKARAKAETKNYPVEPAPPQPVRQWQPAWWHYLVAFFLLLFLGLQVYQPALNGPFVFDDVYLPFMNPNYFDQPLSQWANVRPLLMFSYWLNYQSSALEVENYHLLNVLLHVANSLLVWLIVRRFLRMVDESTWRSEVLAVFSSALFLLHPIQTESVAYVTSRSECLSVFFLLSALAVFIYRRQSAISVPTALAVLLLFGLAASTKEHAVVLPGLLLLTDLWFNPGFNFDGIKRNWKLYAPIAIGAVLGAAKVLQVLRYSKSAGFQLKEFTWYQYLFTQFRSVCAYFRLYTFPIGQSVDHDFPVSHTILQYGAIGYVLILLAIAVVAWRYRREFPLASYGYFGALLLLAPTSSVVPIQDVMVEHRIYLPFICLLLITVDFLRRWKASRGPLIGALSAILVLCAFLSYQRNQMWGSPLTLWQDAVNKAPDKPRPRAQLAYWQMQAGQCSQASEQYAATAKLDKEDSALLINWALALDCANKEPEALAKLQKAAQTDVSAHVYSLIGMIYGKQSKIPQSLEALSTAEKLDPQWEMTYVYRGNDYMTIGQPEQAIGEYQKAIAIDPRNQGARDNLAAAQRQLRQKR
jgi:tetratricopeptide (TPR) repeat protein